jgi:hypothetical protein
MTEPRPTWVMHKIDDNSGYLAIEGTGDIDGYKPRYVIEGPFFKTYSDSRPSAFRRFWYWLFFDIAFMEIE